MASYDPEAPYAIRQFELDVLIPIEAFGLDLSFTTSAQAMVTTLLLVTGFLAYGIRKRALVPDRMQAAAEGIYRFVANTVVKTAGPNAKPAIPLVFSLFVFVLFGSLFGLTPVKFTFTSHLVVTLALALVVFVYANFLGLRTQGSKFFRIFLPSRTGAM